MDLEKMTDDELLAHFRETCDDYRPLETELKRRFGELKNIINGLVPLAEMAINGTPTGSSRNEMTEKVIRARAAIAEKEVPNEEE